MTKTIGKYSEVITVRFTEAEHKKILSNCEELGLSKSNYIRASIMSKQIRVQKAARLDTKSIAELSRLGGLLKHLHNISGKTSGGAYSAESWDVLSRIKSLIIKLHESIE